MNDKNTFKIIIIDDNKSIHEDFIKILKTESFDKLDHLSSELFGENADELTLPQFEIDVATQGKEGVEKIRKSLEKGIHYALAFVDIRMPPGWDGIETIKHIWELDKDIQIVICTAYSDYSWEETVSHLGKKDNLLILKKPFDNISVRQLACALTTKWQLADDVRKYTGNLKLQVEDKTHSLQKSLSLIKSTFESSSDGILVISNNGSIIDYNHRMISMLNIPEIILESKNKKKFIDYFKSQMEEPNLFIDSLEKDQPINEISINVIKFKNGKIFECYSQPHRLNEAVIGYILDFRDITKRAHLEEDLQFQATHDALTGLGNRIELLKGMKNAIKISDQTHTPFAVIFIDFDRFKLVNDSLSHQVGDELLKKASERLRSTIRKEDILVRLGGDEFVIIFTDIRDENIIKNKVNTLLKLFQDPFHFQDREVTLTASIGVSFYPKDGKTSDILLRNADAAMYRAKANKGNTFEFYQQTMNQSTLDALDKEADLRHAIKNKEFYLCYQPQINLSNEKLISVEALIRWNHPKKGLLLPIDFIPFAEETDLIVPIGEWVLRTACEQNKAWQDEGLAKVPVAVNVSAEQINQANFIEAVISILQETHLDPQYLELELSENIIISSKNVLSTLQSLKELGVLIAIDDFGTGYSSLSYLNKLPIDRLKIDSSFIQHIQSTRDDEVIIRAVIAIAKSLNLKVLAEGVETKDQLNFLKHNQCSDMQGFYFSKPLESHEVRKFLTEKIRTH